MPTIIVEDGSGLPNSNSYMSVLEMRTRASDRGVDFSGLSDDDVGVLLIKSTDYIDRFEPELIGAREFENQALAWPRIDCRKSLGVPKSILAAQYYSAMAIHNGVDLFATVTASDLVIREEVGPLKVAYANSASTLHISGPIVPGVEQALTPYFKSSGAIFEVSRG